MLLPINYICNQKCVFCSADIENNNEKVLIKNLIKRITSDFPRGSILGISGGEPFLTPALLVQVVNEATSKGLKIELLTNATLIVDNRKTLELISSKVSLFNVDFPSHLKEVDFKITKNKKAFALRKKGVQYLLEKELPTRITHVVNKYNYKKIPEFTSYIIKNFPTIEYLQFSYVKGIGAAKENKAIIPEYKNVVPYLLDAFKLLEKNKIEFVFDHIPICFLEDFKKNSVDYQKINNKVDGEYSFEKQKIEECCNCKLSKACPGPRKDYIDIYKKLK